MQTLISLLESFNWSWPWFTACFALWIFRSPLGQLISRLNQIKVRGVSFETSPPPQQETNISAAEEIQRDTGSVVLAARENQIRSDLEGRPFKDNANEREKYLIRWLADTSLAYRFECIYWIIWGSQIEAIRRLNSSLVMMHPESMRDVYDETENKLQGITFERWWGFLQDTCGFAIIEEKEAYEESTAHITPLGREFLIYMIAKGYSFHKPG